MDNTLDISARPESIVDDNEAEDVLSLVQRAKSGDLLAFDSLILSYRQRLYSVIYNMTMNSEDAADLTQEAFVKAFRSLAKFREKSSFYTWLYRIGVNLDPHSFKKTQNPQVF